MHLTRELHIIQAHLLYYASLLQDFQKSVRFVLETPNPGMEGVPSKELQDSNTLLKKECQNLLSEIERLEGTRTMQGDRLKNVMGLVSNAACVSPWPHIHCLAGFCNSKYRRQQAHEKTTCLYENGLMLHFSLPTIKTFYT